MENLIDYRKFGSFLIDQGRQFLQKATPIQKTRWTDSSIRNAVSEVTGLNLPMIYSADEYHDTTDIDTWRNIIENDWSNKKEYIPEIFDCDNYAGYFTNYASFIYELNSAGRLTVELKDPNTGKHIGYHRCALIIDRNLKCWLLETQTDQMVPMEKGNPFVIDNWQYVPIYFDLN
jgi:hypothetical protein